MDKSAIEELGRIVQSINSLNEILLRLLAGMDEITRPETRYGEAAIKVVNPDKV